MQAEAFLNKPNFTSNDNLEEQILDLEMLLGKSTDPKKYLIERRDKLLKEWKEKGAALTSSSSQKQQEL